jgi:AcrR family transcriptional regulator
MGSRPAGKAGRPSSADSEETRRKIIDAARKCFGDCGYRETTNRLVASVAEVSTGTVYHYFKSKKDMFLTVHRGIQDEIYLRLQPIYSHQGTLPEILENLFSILGKLLMERPDFGKFNAVVRIEASRNPEISDALTDEHWRRLYRLLARRGVETGAIAPANEKAARRMLSMLVLGLVQHQLETTLENHLECIRGVSLLFRGELIQAS